MRGSHGLSLPGPLGLQVALFPEEIAGTPPAARPLSACPLARAGAPTIPGAARVPTVVRTTRCPALIPTQMLTRHQHLTREGICREVQIPN